MPIKSKIYTVIFIAALLFSAPARAADPMHGPWDAPGCGPVADISTSGFDYTLWLYQSFVSSGSGHSCPMEPSCSAFARQSFASQGSVYGWILTADRLLRCGRDEITRAQRLTKNGRILFLDPVSDNASTWGNGNLQIEKKQPIEKPGF